MANPGIREGRRVGVQRPSARNFPEPDLDVGEPDAHRPRALVGQPAADDRLAVHVPRLQKAVELGSPRDVHPVDPEPVAGGDGARGLLVHLHGAAREAEVLLEPRVSEVHGLLPLRRRLQGGRLEQVPHPLRPAPPVPLDGLGQVRLPYGVGVRVLEGPDAPLVHTERVLEPPVLLEEGRC
uniref:Uncharacterized protein n=1 Tax=Triticum urartu TaxID=4572 RepID=A0A8R7V4X5_TRIUA